MWLLLSVCVTVFTQTLCTGGPLLNTLVCLFAINSKFFSHINTALWIEQIEKFSGNTAGTHTGQLLMSVNECLHVLFVYDNRRNRAAKLNWSLSMKLNLLLCPTCCSCKRSNFHVMQYEQEIWILLMIRQLFCLVHGTSFYIILDLTSKCGNQTEVVAKVLNILTTVHIHMLLKWREG